jgi:hypothetical protein
MHRCSTAILIILATASLGLLTSCLGSGTKNSTTEGVKTVTINPAGNQSIDVGDIQIFGASATNALGQAVPGASIQFVVTSGDSNPAPLTILASGAACAGTWDSTGTICSPGSPGVAIVFATAEGVTSAKTTIYVHQHINKVVVSRIDNPTPPQYDCFSQGTTWDYEAVAYDINNLDITNTVGPINWTVNNGTVATLTPITSGQANVQNQVQVTAKTPGITQLFATVAGATSAPLATPFTTCLVSYIRLQAQGTTTNSFSLVSGSKTVTATAVDTLGNTLANPPLTWSSSDPDVASFSNATSTNGTNSVTARVNAGGTNISASCTPPTCNIGVLPGLPVYGSTGNLPVGGQPVGPLAFGVISASVTPLKIPTYSAWAATTQCKNTLNCQSLAFAVSTGTTPVGASATLSRTPNSMLFNEQGTRIYFGSNLGLMYLDVNASPPTVTEVSTASTPCNVALCGKVLAISPDGNRVVVADSISTPHQVYVFNAASGAGAPLDLVLSNPAENALAAAFSPDEMKIFILTDAGNMYISSSVDSFTSFSVATSATDVAFSADGSIAYVAGDPASAITGYSTCAVPTAPTVNLGTGVTAATPRKIFMSPFVQADGTALITTPGPNQNAPSTVQSIIALEPPFLEVLTGDFTQPTYPAPPPPPPPADTVQYICRPPVVSSPLLTSSFTVDLGQGSFTPLYMRVVNNGTGVVIVANLVPAVLFVDLNQHTTTPIALVNNGLPLAASASSDGSQVYVATCDVYTNNGPTQCTSGSVHIVNRDSGGDMQQVPYTNFNTGNSMCTVASTPPCFPDMIAIKAQ